jgi:UDP-N-acetylmuramoyl-L-alanyl-D-glutamate--2,6-diaminopimelate ligase
VGDALARGAVAVVVEEEVCCGAATRVVVENCRQALARLAARYYNYPARQLLMAGITGTNGKTTTAFLLRQVLAAAGRSCGYVGTLGYMVGEELEKIDNTTPEAPQLQGLLRAMVEAGRRAAVLEVSSHGLALERVAGLPFRVAVFTNLTRDHLDFHGTPQAYFNAKARLFEELGAQGRAVINADDPAATELMHRTRAPVLTYGNRPAAQVRLEELRMGSGGMQLRVATPGGRLELNTQLTGNFNCHNVLAALAAGLALELEKEDICRGIAALERVPGRFERVVEGQDFEVIVDYAHTPDALERVLRAARQMSRGRLICAFGCGGDRDRGKRPAMGAIAGELADLVIVTSDNPRSEAAEKIIAEIEAGLPPGAPAQRLADRRQAIGAAIEQAHRGDVVVIAGKGHETGQILADRVVPFDDRQEASQALRRRLAAKERKA